MRRNPGDDSLARSFENVFLRSNAGATGGASEFNNRLCSVWSSERGGIARGPDALRGRRLGP